MCSDFSLKTRASHICSNNYSNTILPVHIPTAGAPPARPKRLAFSIHRVVARKLLKVYGLRPLWRRPWLYCAAKPSPAGNAGLRSAEETEEGTTTVPMPVEEYGFDDDVEKTLCGSA